jgi:subtilisin family serine protease
VLDRQNKYDDAQTVARGLRWAVDAGADVINLSLGGVARSDPLAEALAYATAHDVIVIACTGNVASAGGPPNEVWYPAREPGVIAVAGLADEPSGPVTAGSGTGAARGGAGGGSDALWTGSLTGPQTVLSAPAVNLVGARPGGYWRVQGTSFAAPLVTASATLVRSRFPQLSAANVINRLIRTARDLGPSGRDDRFGYGEVDPLTALTADVAAVAGNPLTLAGVEPGVPAATPLATSDAGSGSVTAAPAEGPSGAVAGLARRTDSTEDLLMRAGVGIGIAALVLLATLGAAAVSRKYAHGRVDRPGPRAGGAERD